MNEQTGLLLAKAERAIVAAQHLEETGDIEFAIGRAYYAMFFVAEALLNEQGLHFTKYGGVHRAFGDRFVKTGIFDAQYHRWLITAYNRRIVSDYGVEVVFTREEAREVILQAQQFLKAANVYAKSLA